MAAHSFLAGGAPLATGRERAGGDGAESGLDTSSIALTCSSAKPAQRRHHQMVSISHQVHIDRDSP